MTGALVERFVAGLLHAGVQSAGVGLALIAVAALAGRVSAPWRFLWLAAGLLRFALPALPNPVRVDLPWLPAFGALQQPLSGVDPGHAAPLLFAIWAAGALIQLARLVWVRIGWSRRLARAAHGAVPAILLEEARCAARAIGAPMPRVRVSAEVDAPLVTGPWRPTVIVDHGWFSLDARARHLVLLHEMAHVKRGDLLWVELASWAAVVWWWHPVFRLLVSRMRAAQEDACDDLALCVEPEPDHYCRTLLDVAARAVAPAPALGLEPLGFDGRVLERRLRRLMDPATRRASVVSRSQWVSVALLVVVVFTAFGAHAIPRGTPFPRHLQKSFPPHPHDQSHSHTH